MSTQLSFKDLVDRALRRRSGKCWLAVMEYIDTHVDEPTEVSAKLFYDAVYEATDLKPRCMVYIIDCFVSLISHGFLRDELLQDARRFVQSFKGKSPLATEMVAEFEELCSPAAD